MRVFLKKVICFSLLLALVLGILLGVLFVIVAPVYSRSFNAALIDKAERLLSINEPKIVLIGNSNVAFGFDSALLEAAFQMPVVNMGLHGGLGNAFAEQAALLNPQPGDIYIVCHTEYEDTDTILDPSLAWITIENHTELWRMIRAKDWPLMIKSIPSYLRHIIRKVLLQDESDAVPPYARASFNEYGDVDDLRSKSLVSISNLLPPDIGDTTTNRLNELDVALAEHGAKLLVAAYPIAYANNRPHVDAFDAFEDQLQSELNCPVISNFTDYFFHSSLLYDTAYHLTTEGAKQRTRLLIDDLLQWNPSLLH